jgi:hypothetical protein
MFFYAIHNIPYGSSMSRIERNGRTMLYSSICYFLLYIFINSNYSNNFSKVKYLKKYFWWIFIIDVALFIMLYKVYLDIFELKLSQFIKFSDKSTPPSETPETENKNEQVNDQTNDETNDETNKKTPLNVQPEPHSESQSDNNLNNQQETQSETQPDDNLNEATETECIPEYNSETYSKHKNDSDEIPEYYTERE